MKTVTIIYATFIGTDYETEIHLESFSRLKKIANDTGFIESERPVKPIADQTDLRKWKLELKGQYNENIEFLLAVTAPKLTTMSPIPIKMDTGGYLFSVIHQQDTILIWNGMMRKFYSPKSTEEIEKIFIEFLVNVKWNSK